MCVIDIYSKYALVVPLKNRKGITIANVFQKIWDELWRKPHKIWVDQGCEFWNRSMKSWLEGNGTEMCLMYESVATERFIRALKNKIYKYMTSILKMSISIN